jgi:O-acetylhomoserine/O-acetylserine sulfhydrylase-like pyridoxal-dependent enzyme
LFQRSIADGEIKNPQATRMTNQQNTALKVSSFLQNHPKVAMVRYPGLENFPQADLARRQMTSYEGKFAPGSIIYFVLKDWHDIIEDLEIALDQV